MEMVYISKLQETTLKLVDELINERKNFDEIAQELIKQHYSFRVETKNGKYNKNHLMLYKMKLEGNKILSEEYSFVDLVQKRGKVTWETVKLH